MWETKFLEHSPEIDVPYLFYTKFHFPRPIFYWPSSKCTHIGRGVSFPHCYLNQRWPILPINVNASPVWTEKKTLPIILMFQTLRPVIVRRAGLLWSQRDFEWRWSVRLFKCLTVLEFSFILFDLCLLITFFNFIMNYVPIVTFWIFTYHKIWILSIMFCFIWSYWIIYFLACL